VITLNIQILPHHYNDGADLIVNDNTYLLHPDSIRSLDDIRTLLSNEPEYVYTAVISMLEEMTK
jgi:hypothetical protein